MNAPRNTKPELSAPANKPLNGSSVTGSPPFSPHRPPTAFVYALIHEIRNPVNNISLSVGLLKPLLKDNELNTYLDIIQRSTKRINDLISDLLKNQELWGMRLELYSIHDLLDEALDVNKDRIQLENITVVRKYTTENCNLVVSCSKIKVAFVNIILNAIEAMDHANGQLEITTTCTEEKIKVRIKDNGHGISKENLNQIFNPFFTNKANGLGLGLATTNHILQLHRADVVVESEVGKGTDFMITFSRQ